MYNLIRKIHLYVAFSLLLLTLMYFVSGYIMIHGPWFGSSEPQVTQEIIKLSRPLKGNEPNISEYLQKELNLSGKRFPAKKQENGTIVFNYWRPGEEYEIILTPNKSEVIIKRRQWQWQGTMIGFHRIHDYMGGVTYTVWAFLLDIVSLSLIVFGITGIIMWYKLTTKRLLGWILLSITYIYSFVTILYLLYAP
jgi:hypothetical protein